MFIVLVMIGLHSTRGLCEYDTLWSGSEEEIAILCSLQATEHKIEGAELPAML